MSLSRADLARIVAVGCLCSLSPRYVPQNNWNHGFAIVERDDDGEFVVDNRRIIEGKVF